MNWSRRLSSTSFGRRAVQVLLSVALLIGGAACSTSSTPPPEGKGSSSSLVGKAAPDFTLPAAGGGTVSLSDYRGKKAVLLYFSMGPG